MTAVVVLNDSFAKQVDALEDEWRKVESRYASLCEQQLRFALTVRNLLDEAKKLDSGSKVAEHYTLLKQRVMEIVRSDSQQIMSRWRTISSYAEALLPHASSLPAQRDSLYQLAVSMKQNAPVNNWIEQGLLRPDMTVREVKALATPKPQRKKSSAAKERTVNVHLSFDASYSEVAELLSEILQAKNLVRVQSGDALREAFKSKLGKAGYQEIEQKFI
jgi:hypothetical protein